MPTGPEVMITLGVWATGFIVLTILYKIATTVKEDSAGMLRTPRHRRLTLGFGYWGASAAADAPFWLDRHVNS